MLVGAWKTHSLVGSMRATFQGNCQGRLAKLESGDPWLFFPPNDEGTHNGLILLGVLQGFLWRGCFYFWFAWHRVPLICGHISIQPLVILMNPLNDIKFQLHTCSLLYIVFQALEQKASLHPKLLEKIESAEKMFAWNPCLAMSSDNLSFYNSFKLKQIKMSLNTKRLPNQIKMDNFIKKKVTEAQ